MRHWLREYACSGEPRVKNDQISFFFFNSIEIPFFLAPLNKNKFSLFFKLFEWKWFFKLLDWLITSYFCPQVRRSLKIPGRRKEKEKLPSGITADYSASFFAYLDRDLLENSQNSSSSGQSVRTGNNWNTRTPDGLTQSDSSETSLTSLTITTTSSATPTNTSSGQSSKNLPPLPPKPPKRGILKGPRLSISGTTNSLAEENTLPNGNETNYQEASNLLVRNTLQNEVIAYQNVPVHLPGYGNAVNKEEGCSEEETQTQGSWQVSPQRAAQQNQHQHQQHHQQHHHHHHHQSDGKLLQVCWRFFTFNEGISNFS